MDITIANNELIEILSLVARECNECGSAEGDTVILARLLAERAGLNPNVFTPSSDRGRFPHAYMPDKLHPGDYRGRVPEYRKPLSFGGFAQISRPETDEEVLARIGNVETRCTVYPCGRSKDDPIHIVP